MKTNKIKYSIPLSCLCILVACSTVKTSYDFDKDFTGEEILKEAIRIKGGDILVFHDSDKAKMNLQNSLEENTVFKDAWK